MSACLLETPINLISHGITILAQLATALLTAAGWGYWISRLVPSRPPRVRSDILLLGISGWCANLLFLQGLLYLDVRLHWSSWIGWAIALAGLLGICCGKFRPVPGASRFRRWVAVGLVAFAFQSSGLFLKGPAEYFGYAHQDQVNSVQLSQFLVEMPFSTGLGNVGLHPWLVKPIDLKTGRIGQAVPDGYLAVTTGTDSQGSYGVTTIFFLALVPVVMMELLLRLGAGRRLAFLGAIWAGILPAFTKAHLDGFVSQTETLFVVPSLLLALFSAPRQFWLACVSAALLLGFLLCAYTEVYILGVGVAGFICLSSLRLSIRRRVVLMALSAGGSLLAAAPYAICYAWAFAAGQYGAAGGMESVKLTSLVPYSGTWAGWAELFFGPGLANNALCMVAEFSGILLLLPMAAGLFSRSLSRACLLAGAAAVPVSALAVLRFGSIFHPYPFNKLLVTFLPLEVLLITLGLRRMQIAAHFLPHRNWTHPVRASASAGRNRRVAFGGTLALCLLVASAGMGSWNLEKQVLDNAEILAAVNSPGARAVYRELDSHPDRRYVIKEQHPIVNAWLAYHGRHSDMYADTSAIGDRPVPQDQFAFRRLPAHIADSWLVTGERIAFYGNREASPELILRNPQGIERDGILTWCWVGDQMQIEIVDFGSGAGRYHLLFHALSGPANPPPHRAVTLTDERTGRPQHRDFDNDAFIDFPVFLNPGSNLFRLAVDSPNQWLVHLAGDARKLMVRIQEVEIRRADTEGP